MANSITKHIPNAITCCNLISGCIATTFALREQFSIALIFIVVGAIFDFFDGLSARALHVSNPIGKELDSLADVVTFGVAPSAMVFAVCSSRFMVYPEALGSASQYLPYLAFLLAAFSALRLAKFNLDTRQTTSFIGLPTPANALFWASLITAYRQVFYAQEDNFWGLVLLAGVFVFCYFLVAEFPMFALKFKSWSWKGNEIKYTFVCNCIVLIGLLGISGIAASIVWYLVLSALTQRK